MEHGILGAGGIGGLLGAVLARGGASVTLILRPESLKRHPGELSLETPSGSFAAPVALGR